MMIEGLSYADLCMLAPQQLLLSHSAPGTRQDILTPVIILQTRSQLHVGDDGEDF